jgi:GST-like protein
MFQMGGVGPMLGQAHHFRMYAPEKIQLRHRPLQQRGAASLRRDRQAALGQPPASPAPSYSIADIATFPWLRSWQNQGVVMDEYPHLRRWFDTIEERPAVQRGVKVLADLRKPITDDKAREVLFGKTQYAKR